jgi:cobalt-zinc-cadmium efflux system outer membrane protein
MINIASSKWLVASSKSGMATTLLGLLLSSGFAGAAEINCPDLPPPAQVKNALSEHLLVLNAASGLKMEHANQHRWNNGNYEFTLRAGSSQRNIANTGLHMKEWDVALERPFRLPNKIGIDQNIGAANIERAEFALGDARHEAGRMLLKLWFGWQREMNQSTLWQQQTDILQQQAAMTARRVKAGDAAKLEFNQATAAAAQAGVSWRQAQMRAQLAENDLSQSYPAIRLPEKLTLTTPQPIDHDFAYWKSLIFADNHELGMVQAQSHVQQLLAQRSRADQIPDPTVGMRFANEMGGNEKITGIYFMVPLSIGHRSAIADSVEQQAAIAEDQATFVKRRLEGDVYAAYLRAIKNFDTWRLAHEAAIAIRNNAELVARAYTLGEASLSDSLTARRLAMESSLTEIQTQLDANEARYRLLLDAHQLWPQDDEPAHD